MYILLNDILRIQADYGNADKGLYMHLKYAKLEGSVLGEWSSRLGCQNCILSPAL